MNHRYTQSDEQLPLYITVPSVNTQEPRHKDARQGAETYRKNKCKREERCSVERHRTQLIADSIGRSVCRFVGLLARRTVG